MPDFYVAWLSSPRVNAIVVYVHTAGEREAHANAVDSKHFLLGC